MRGAGAWGALLARFAALGAVVGLACFGVRVNLIGGIFVRDPLAVARAIAIEYDDRKAPLWRLPGRLYFGWPEGSGELVLSCANGRRVERTIVVSGLSQHLTLQPLDCGG